MIGNLINQSQIDILAEAIEEIEMNLAQFEQFMTQEEIFEAEEEIETLSRELAEEESFGMEMQEGASPEVYFMYQGYGSYLLSA